MTPPMPRPRAAASSPLPAGRSALWPSRQRHASFGCAWRDREVRCDAGAAPATVSGETAARATGPPDAAGREGAAVGDPEPGDLLARRPGLTVLGWRS